jgi:CheY-like chemotaxis protein
LAERVRAAAGARPLLLVAITGVGTDEARRRTADAGFDRHLTKPADPAELFRILTAFG